MNPPEPTIIKTNVRYDLCVGPQIPRPCRIRWSRVRFVKTRTKNVFLKRPKPGSQTQKYKIEPAAYLSTHIFSNIPCATILQVTPIFNNPQQRKPGINKPRKPGYQKSKYTKHHTYQKPKISEIQNTRTQNTNIKTKQNTQTCNTRNPKYQA